jgi:hypothetical protein
MALESDPFHRDDQGRFAVRPENGGGGNFAPPESADWGDTRTALTKFATSQKSSAPRMGGSTYEPPAPFDAHAALAAVTPDHGSVAPGGSSGGEGQGTQDDEGFHPGLRAAGYGSEEGPANSDISDRFGTRMPGPIQYGPQWQHPYSRAQYNAETAAPDFGGTNQFGEADSDDTDA